MRIYFQGWFFFIFFFLIPSYIKNIRKQQMCPCGQEGQRFPGCIEKSVANRLREVVLSPREATFRVLCWVLCSPVQEDRKQRATKMMRGLEHLLYEERARNLKLFSLDKRRLRGDLITIYKYLKYRSQTNGTRLFSLVCSDRTRGYRYKLEHRKIHTNTKKKPSTVWVTEYWSRLSRDIVEFPLEIFKSSLETFLCNLL